MKPNGKRHRTVPIQLGGMFSAGDLSALPDSFVSILRNYMIRANRFDGRAPFVYDSLDAVSGFAVWQDMANELQKTVATCSADNKLYTKNSNGQGYGTGLAGLTASARLTSYTNFLNKLWMAFDNGAGVPASMALYDGATINTAPFANTINCRAITTFINRNFMIQPRVTFTNVMGSLDTSVIQLASIYDMTEAGNSRWTSVPAGNVVGTNIPSGIATIGRLAPKSLTDSYSFFGGGGTPAGYFGHKLTSSSKPQTVVLRAEFQGVDATYNVPITLGIALSNVRQQLTVYPLNSVVEYSFYRFRCVVAGTSAAGFPASFTNVIGTDTVDGTVTWRCEGTWLLASANLTVINATDAPDFSAFYLSYTLPPTANDVAVTPYLLFGNSSVPLTQLSPINISYRDGLTDGDPKKANHGWQLTDGALFLPFFNQESSLTTTVDIDAVIWSEISDPKQILARNTYPLTEIAGLATASIVSNGRLVVFKRSGMWIFKGTVDPYEPILPESPALQVGCIGPLALACSRDNVLYWIGENHVYKMAIGSDAGPTEIDSPGMFEEIFSRGASWVESQGTYNMPLLAIDHANKDVWVYTQKGKIYVYSIQSGLWSYIDTNPTGTSAEVRAMIFDPASNRMLVSFGGAAATRFDETSDAADTIATGGGSTWNIANDIVPKPFELFAPRFEASLLEVGLFHLASIQNGSLTISYSYDRGATYTTPAGYPVTAWLTNPRIRLSLAATGESVTTKLSRTGSGGKRNWAISKADALLRVHRGESPKVNPS